MANRFFSPNQQFADNTGLPYAGGSLAFYASGTSTPLATYSDSALTIANTNPVVLDSAGRAGNIFLQNLAYKVVLSDVNSNPIWTDDPVYSSDYSARAKLLTGSGSPNGTVAGTAGSPGIGADTYWDSTNNILYVCTVTGTSVTAVWTAVNASTAAAVVPSPQGYLTLTSGVPIIPSDVISATSLVYTPYVGNTVPIYTGVGFSPTTFSELTLTLTASQAASTIYDVFVFNNSGVLTLVTGPAWSSSTAAAGARGTGAGTTQISRLNGVLVNTVQISGKNGATTYTVAANQATYLGSILIDTVAGQITCHRSWGKDRKWAVWNAYNRANIFMQEGDTTSPSSVTTYPTFGAYNADATNRITIFTGLAEEQASCNINLQGIQGAVNRAFYAAIGLNSTTTATGTVGRMQSIASEDRSTIMGYCFIQPSLGVNVIQELIASDGVTVTYVGGQPFNMMTAAYRG